MNLLSQLPWGVVLDFLGPRVCNLWSTTLVICGFVLLSLSARGVTDAYLTAICLIAGGGPGAQISLFHLSELFPMKQKSTVLSVVTGAFQLGFVVFLLFQQANARFHIDLADLALIYCVPLVAMLLLGGVMWPDAPCIPPDDFDPMSFTSRRPSQAGLIEYDGRGQPRAQTTEAFIESVPHKWRQQAPVSIAEYESPPGQSTEQKTGVKNVSEAAAREEAQPLVRNANPYAPSGPSEGEYGSLPSASSSPSLHAVHRSLHALRVSASNPNLAGTAASQGFLAQLTAPSYLLCLMWMCACLFWANFYIGTVVEQIYAKSGRHAGATREYTNVFTLCLPSGVLGIGVFGYLTAELGFGTSIAATTTFGVGYAASSLALPLHWQPLTFVLYSFFRSFLFSVMFAYLANEFGYRHFGLLSGIMLGLAGSLGYMQYAVERRMVVDVGDDEAAFRDVNLMQLYTLVASFYFAVFVCWRQQARAKRVEKQIEHHTRQLDEARMG